MMAFLGTIFVILSLSRLLSVSSFDHQIEKPNYINVLACSLRFKGSTKTLTHSLTPHPKTHHARKQTLLLFLLLAAGDVEPNPGPPLKSTFPCGYCQTAVTWSDQGVCCDDCSMWHHKSCLDMNSADFDILHNPDVRWQCCKCDNVNVNSFSYHSYSLDQSHLDYYYAPSTSSNCDDLTSNSIPSPNPNNSRTINTFKSPLKASTPKRTEPNAASSNISTNSSSGNSNSHNTNGTRNSEDLPLPPKTNLRILNLNCRGLQQKTSELKGIIDYVKPDIVCGTESFLRGIKPGKNPESNTIYSPEIFPPYFNVYRNDRNSDGGGVFILIHQNLVSMETPQFVTDCEITWAKIHLKGCKELYISTFYMPHRNIPDLNALDTSLLKVNEKGNRHMILCGDFNCPDIDWKNHQTSNGADDRLVQEKLVDIAQTHSLTQLQKEPTRYNNILDLTFTNNPSLIKSCTVVPGISDHSAVVIDSTIRPNYILSKKRKVHQFKKAQWEDLYKECDEITKEIQLKFNAGDCINSLWDIFKSKLHKAIDNYIPSKNIRMNNDLPWMNGNLRKLVRKKTKLHKKATKSRNWTKFNDFQKICETAFRKA